MREIKFRDWSNEQNKFIGTEMIYFKTDGTPNIRESTILNQYTGLLDKNGKEIYEGDVIIFGDDTIKQIVEFKEGQYMAKQIGTYGSYVGLGYGKWDKIATVIGNIYENPELLK